MKTYNIFKTFLIILTLVFTACEPIEDREYLTNSIKGVDDIDLSVIQESGSNSFSLQMTTPGVTGYWDYITGTKYTDRVDVIFPVTGEFTFTYYMSTPFMVDNNPSEIEFLSKSITVNIDKLDVPLKDEYYQLGGTTLEGKTWVFDGVPFDNTLWWYMTHPDNPDVVWWNAAGECCPPANINFVQDASAEMTFTLLGEYIYELNGEITKGVKWSFSEDLKSLTISDPTVIPGYQNEWGEPRANADGKYQILELTEDRLVLWTNKTINETENGGDAVGWKWVFKPKE